MSDRLLKELEEVKSFPVITLGTIIDQLGDEALLIITLVSTLPFLQPIPIPGVSTVLGLIILLQGVGLMVWQKPVLTKALRERTITREHFELVYKAAKKFSWITRKIATYQHPLTATRACHVICGGAIVLTAAFLSLPLPIPFSNFVPAISIFLICLGLLEEDLILMVTGLGIAASILWMAFYSYHLIREQLQAWL